MYILNEITVTRIVGGNWDIGASETVYFESVLDHTIIGWHHTLIALDTQLDCPYPSHYNQWTLPLYEVTPIYVKLFI